jgi:hypothetical protein
MLPDNETMRKQEVVKVFTRMTYSWLWAEWACVYLHSVSNSKTAPGNSCTFESDPIVIVYDAVSIMLTYINISEQPQLIGAWTPQGVESVPQEYWATLTPMLPIVLSSWL